jgi:hypothetical protein
MKVAAAILTAGLALLLTGCITGGKPKTVLAAAPAPPKPVIAPAPPPPPPQLSSPQTQAELPAYQPISQEAMTTLQASEEAPATPATPSRSTRTRMPSTAPHGEPPATVGPPATAAPPADVTTERPTVGELVSAEEQQKLLADAQRARQEAKQLVDRASTHRLNRQRQDLKNRVESFLKLSQEAEDRADFRQASKLAGQALVLAKDLQP